MADADVEQLPPVEEVPPPEAELPPPEIVPEEDTNSAPSFDIAYWKSYPGIWKILHIIFGVISLICIIICYIPEWTWSKDGEACPLTWRTSFDPHDGTYRLDVVSSLDRLVYDVTPATRAPDASTVTPSSGYAPIPHDHGISGFNPNLYSNSYTNGGYKRCYGSLVFPDGAWGPGRHDVWLYAWTVYTVCILAADIVIIVFKSRDSDSLKKFKLPLLIYYLILVITLDVPAIAMIIHTTIHMAWYHITLPQAVPALVGGFYTLLNMLAHGFSMYWIVIHNAL